MVLDKLLGGMMIPSSILEGVQMETSSRTQAKVNAFASIFDRNDEYTREELFQLLSDNNVVSDSIYGRVKSEIMLFLRYGEFSDDCWYKFNSSYDASRGKKFRFSYIDSFPG